MYQKWSSAHVEASVLEKKKKKKVTGVIFVFEWQYSNRFFAFMQTLRDGF